MVSGGRQNPSLGEAARFFLATLSVITIGY